jgi:DNA polymerase/3'-5' exonuclease PolX
LEELEKPYKEMTTVIDKLTTIFGIGPQNAKKFYEMGVKSIEDLGSGRYPLTDAQSIGYSYREHLVIKIPRDEMNVYQETVGTLLPGINFEIVGSYRRGEIESGDIDIMVTKRLGFPTLKQVVERLRPIIVETLAFGDQKFMGISRLSRQYLYRRIDIRVFEEENWAPALMYFTGSQKFNVLMRQRAIELGMHLDEYGLYALEPIMGGGNTKNIVPTREEIDIFNKLGVKYLYPVQRTREINELSYG